MFATIPWISAHGVLWLSAGVVDEIDLLFINFPSTRSDAPDWIRPPDSYRQGGGTPEQEIEAIIQIYEAIQSLHPKPARPVNCYRNSLTPTQHPCEGVSLTTDRLSPTELRAALRDFLALISEESDDGRAPDGEVARTLNLGQWWLPNGSLAMLVVMPNSNFIPGDEDSGRAWGLALSVNA